MSARSLNKVQLIGNLTRDPELRYTPNGTAVCSFGLATNRSWTTETGEKKEEVEFHKIVAWNKLAELCSQLLAKGRKIYVEGRLQTRAWTAQDGAARQSTEIVIEDMIILDSKRVETAGMGAAAPVAQAAPVEPVAEPAVPAATPTDDTTSAQGGSASGGKKKKTEGSVEAVEEKKPEEKVEQSDQINPDDIPF